MQWPRLVLAWDTVHVRYPVKSSQVNLFSQTLLGPQREKKRKEKSTKPCTKKKVAISQQSKECLHTSRFNHAFTVSFNTHTPFLHFASNNLIFFHKLLCDSFVTSRKKPCSNVVSLLLIIIIRKTFAMVADKGYSPVIVRVVYFTLLMPRNDNKFQPVFWEGTRFPNLVEHNNERPE